ncbi:transposase [Methylobacterium sp. Leaf90]|nr:transposase [Methylobacterium sp. Leaf90]
MKRGRRPSAEQVVLKLRQIEVQTAQGKSIAVACKEADVSERSYVTSTYARRSSTR